MRSSINLCISLFFGASISAAALPPEGSKALSFYRTADSAFPSGQISRDVLEEGLRRSEMKIQFKVQWDHKTYTLPGSHLLRDIQVAYLAKTKSSVQLLSSKQRSAHPLQTLNRDVALTILETDDYWARVQVPQSRSEGWLPLHKLEARREDPGVFVNLIDTYLRKAPSNQSPVVTTLPRLRRVLPLAYDNNFIKLLYQGQTLYADINHFTSKADFANLIYDNNKQWQPVTHRENSFAITTKGDRVPLQNIRAYVTNDQRAIVSEASEGYGPQLRSRVNILTPEAHLWGVSHLRGHGEVWWQQTNLLLPSPKKNQKTLTTEELIKRGLSAIAFEEKSSLRGLASANGVFRTEDGHTWVAIPQFSNGDYPVSIHPNNNWFIGSYRSIDRGKSFEPFIRWEQIASAIEGAYHRNPKILKLTQITSLPDSRLQIQIDTGARSVNLRTSLTTLRWEIVKP